MSITLSRQQVEQLAKAYWKLDQAIIEECSPDELALARESLKDVLRAHHILDDWGNLWEEHKD